MKNKIQIMFVRGLQKALNHDNGPRLPRHWKVIASTLLLLFTLGIGNVWGDEYLLSKVRFNDGDMVAGMSSATVQWLKHNGTAFSATTDFPIPTYEDGSTKTVGGNGFYCYQKTLSGIKNVGTGTTWSSSSSSGRYIQMVKLPSGKDVTLALGTKVATKITIIAECGSAGAKTISIGGVSHSLESTAVKNTLFSHEFTKSGNFTGNITISQNADFYAAIILTVPATYTVTVNPDGGSTTAEGWTLSTGNYIKSGIISGTSVTLPTMTQLGYDFNGWKDNHDNTISSPITITKDTTLVAQWTLSDCTDVDAPTGLAEKTSARTTSAITFEWTAASNASSYDVKLWDNSSCTGDPIASGNVTTTSKEFTGLTDGTTYYCKVQSKGDGSTYCTAGGTTDAVSGTTATIPSYNVTVATSTGDNTRGTVSPAASSVKMGATTLITAVPASGYRVSAWSCAGTGASIDPSGPSNSNTTTLTMGSADATVTVSFEEIPCIGNEGGTLFSANAITTSNVSFSTGTTEILAEQATITGGKIYAISSQTDPKTLLTNGGKFSMTNNDTRFHFVLDCALRAGDTIKIDGQGGTKSDAPKGLLLAATDSKPASPSASGTNSTDSWHEPILSYVVTGSDEYVDGKDLYIFRAAGATQNFDNVRIIRPAKYAMTFAPGDGSGSMAAVQCIEKSEVTLPACTFTAPENKEFDAWVVTKTVGGASVTVTNGKFTMPQEAVTATATWKAATVKYHVTYDLNGASGDAPTETDKAENDEFALAAAPSWDGYHFEGWKWTDNSSVDHMEDAGDDFTMPAYDVEFTAQWKPYATITLPDGEYFLGDDELNVAANFSSNSEAAVVYELKENYGDDASITGAGMFTATAVGEYVVVANQAGNATYAATSKEATITVYYPATGDATIIYEVKVGTSQTTLDTKSKQANSSSISNLAGFKTAGGLVVRDGGGKDNSSPKLETPSSKELGKYVYVTFKVADGKEFLLDSVVTKMVAVSNPKTIEIVINDTEGTKDSLNYNQTNNSDPGAVHQFDFTGSAKAYKGTVTVKIYAYGSSANDYRIGKPLKVCGVVRRERTIVSTDIDLTAVTINDVAISAANLATLKTADAYLLDLADEYAAAPTVKFTKTTTVTYDEGDPDVTDDVLSVTASEVSEKWQAQQEINSITYTVKMGISTSYTVNYVDEDGSTSLGSEIVAVGSHPTAAGITATKEWNVLEGWKLNSVLTDLDDVSAAAGETVTLQASYTPAYATSINIEKWVLDNGAGKGNSKVAEQTAAFLEVLAGMHYVYANMNELDSLTAAKNETDRNYPFLGQKIKTTGGYISFLLKAGSELHVKFGNIPAAVNLIVNDGEPVAKSASFDYTAGGSDEIIKLATTTDGTVVFKQIMIDEEIETIKLPAVVTYDANGGSFGKSSEKYTGTPLVIGDATPASDDYLFEGWHVGTVDGDAIDATGYEPTKNVTLVANYVAKPSPFSLSALTYKIGDGAATEVGYVEGTYEYTVKLPYAHSYDAITVAATLSDGTSSLKAAISQPATVPGDASFIVVANDASEQEYVIHFIKEAKEGTEIIGAVVTGNTTATVTGVYKGDASVKLNSKKIDNGDYYIYVTLKDGYTFEETDVLVVDVHTKSDIGTKALEITTGVGDIGGDVWKTIALDDYSTGENIIALTGIAANQTSIGLKRSANINAKINGLKVYRAMNPVLKAIQFNSTDVEVTSTTVAATLPNGTNLGSMTVTPTIYWNGAGTAVVTTNEGAWAWGDNTYRVTDKDGDYTDYTITLTEDVLKYTVSFNTYGGTSIDPIQVVAGEYLAAAPADPTKDENVFKHWAETEDGEAVDVTTVQINADKTFHAVWEAEPAGIKLFNGNVLNTTNFISAAATTIEISEVEYPCLVAFGSNRSSLAGAKQGDLVMYSATTNATKIKFDLYNANTSAKTAYLWMVEEGATESGDPIEIEVSGQTRITTAYYSFNSTKNRSFYLTSGSKNDIKVLQAKVIESGSAIKQFGQAGYSLKLNQGRIAAASAVQFEGATVNVSSEYAVLNNSNLATKSYIKFTTTVDKMILHVEKSGGKFYVSQDPEDKGTIYNANADVELTPAGEWYLGSETSGSAASFSKIEFIAPKCEAPAFNALANSDICEGSSYEALDGTGTVSDGGSITYKWYAEGDAETVLATTATYTPSADGNYYVVALHHVDGYTDNEVTSDVVTVKTHAGTAISEPLADQRGNVDDVVALEVAASGKNLHYAWKECATIDGEYTAVAGAADAASLNVTITEGMDKYYKVIVSSDCGDAQESVAHVTQYVPVAQANVTGSIAWDWTKAASVNEIKLTTSTAPKKNEGFVMANGAATIYNNANFESDKLYLEGEYIVRDGKYFQGQTIKFNATVAGLVHIKFSNTGNNAARELYINGVGTGNTSASATMIYSDYVEVPAGEVSITAYLADKSEDASQKYIRVSEIEFRALEERRAESWIVPGELGTVCLKNDAKVVGANLYELQGHDENGYMAFDQIQSGELEAGKPYLFEATAVGQISFYTAVGANHTDEAGSQKGMYGTFENKVFNSSNPEDLDVYYFSGRHIWAVKNYTVDIPVNAYRCYVKMDEFKTYPADASPAPGRRRVTLGVNGNNAPTDVEKVQSDEVQCTKVMINGQLFILRGEKMFGIDGKLIK